VLGLAVAACSSWADDTVRFPTPEEPAEVASKPVGLCVQISKPGGRVKSARVAVASGDPKRDEDMRALIIGTNAPVVEGWTRGDWVAVWADAPQAEAQSELPAIACDIPSGPSD